MRVLPPVATRHVQWDISHSLERDRAGSDHDSDSFVRTENHHNPGSLVSYQTVTVTTSQKRTKVKAIQQKTVTSRQVWGS
jgi:hypothetical protein